MNDSFSQLAKKIRQDKINKKEIKKIKREIIDVKVLNIIKNNMAIQIQCHLRGYLYRKKNYANFLEEINTQTIIDYLYLKRIERIEKDCKNIILKHMENYLQKIREEKEKIKLQKIESSDLIKAYLKGIIVRKRFSKDLISLKDIKDKIERYILGYKIRLVLRSNNIQSLLIDIANIKYSLNNIEKNNDGNNNHKIKELKTKLTKNINLFYFTFYQMKENSNWISQAKIKDPWIQKYMSIINKDKDNENNKNNNNIFVKKTSVQSIYSNQKKIKRLKENNSKNFDTNKNNNGSKKDSLKNIDGNIIINDNLDNNNKKNHSNDNLIRENKENKDNNSNQDISGDNNALTKSGKNYDFNFYNSESDDSYGKGNLKSSHKETDSHMGNKTKNTEKIEKISKTEKNDREREKDDDNIKEDNDKLIRSNIVKRYKLKKTDGEQKLSPNQSKSFDSKEDEKENEKEQKQDKEITTFNENENQQKMEEEEKKEDNQEQENIEKEKEKENKPKQLNKYEQREERPIKPLKNINFLENENPFGLKTDTGEMNIEKKNSIEKRYISSSRAINRTKITSAKNKKQNISEIEKEETIKTQEKTDLSLNEAPLSNKYVEYDNRPCGGGSKNNAMYDFSKYDESQPPEKLDRNERPLAGANKIDYNAMFGEGGEEFEGDPFGGAKQYESSNKDKVKNVHKTNNVKKKPVYDARKAIEEAKLKEAKEGKKEKPSAFREFLREMKKISAEEKAQHNETNTENVKKEKKSNNKNRKNEIKDKNLDYNTENTYTYSDKHLDSKLDKADKKALSRKKDKRMNLNTENEEESSNVGNNFEEKENTLKKKGRMATNMNKETNALRKKLHELEKAPAPVLNIKGIKSRIECWGNSNDNKRNKINSLAPKSKDTPKSKEEQKNKNKGNEQKLISNYISSKKAKESSEANNTNHSLSNNNIPKISKKMEEKIEKYVDKKLMQLNVQIEELEELFNFDKYFREKEEKMCQFINLPYIKKNYDFVVKYSKDDYDEKMSQIEKVYKELK